MARLIKRGQIWIADLNPGYGAEIHKKRPALIIASNEINQFSHTTIVIPISSQVFSKSIETVLLPKKSTGLEKDSVILPVFVRAIDKNRLIEKVGSISDEKLEEVEDSLKLVLGMVSLD